MLSFLDCALCWLKQCLVCRSFTATIKTSQLKEWGKYVFTSFKDWLFTFTVYSVTHVTWVRCVGDGVIIWSCSCSFLTDCLTNLKFCLLIPWSLLCSLVKISYPFLGFWSSKFGPGYEPIEESQFIALETHFSDSSQKTSAVWLLWESRSVLSNDARILFPRLPQCLFFDHVIFFWFVS